MMKFLTILLFSVAVNAQFSPELYGNVTVSFNGVDCGSCSDKVEKHFMQMKEVQQAKVNPEEKKLYLTLSENKVLSEDFIRKEILKFGYIYTSAKGGFSE